MKKKEFYLFVLFLVALNVGHVGQPSMAQSNEVGSNKKVPVSNAEDCKMKVALNRTNQSNHYTLICLNKVPADVEIQVLDLENEKIVEQVTIPADQAKAFHKKYNLDPLSKGKYLVRVTNGCKVVENLMVRE